MLSGQSRKRAFLAVVIGAACAAVGFGPGGATHAAALTPTQIVAYNPVIANGPQLLPLEVNARLTVNGKPLANKAVYFSSTAGRPEYCHDVTDVNGFAHCNFPFSMLRALKEEGYRATFRGDATYAASTDTIALLLFLPA